MSVKELIRRDTTNIAHSYVNEKVRQEKALGHLNSPVHIASSVYIDEGRKELREISEKLIRSGIRVNPRSHIPIFRQIPLSDRKKARIAYGAITFGVVMISIEQLVKGKVFNQAEMGKLFNYSVDRTFIPPWLSNGLPDVVIPKQDQAILADLVHNDPTHSTVITKGFKSLPEQLRTVINHVGLVPVATQAFLPTFGDMVRKQIREQSVSKRT